MRGIVVALLLSSVMLAACDRQDGIEEAKRQAALDDQRKEKAAPAAKKISPPVPNSAHIPCEQLIDIPAFSKALAEVDPMTVTDASKTEPDAAASCSLVRGGKRPNEAEQKALIKNKGKLGVLPGDELCNITAFCWTIEDADRFRKKCTEVKGQQDDESMGSYSCMRIVPAGEADVQLFRFFDTDTKCILQVRGGPSMTDNDYIRTCAKAARDSIGPAQIAVNAPAVKP